MVKRVSEMRGHPVFGQQVIDYKALRACVPNAARVSRRVSKIVLKHPGLKAYWQFLESAGERRVYLPETFAANVQGILDDAAAGRITQPRTEDDWVKAVVNEYIANAEAVEFEDISPQNQQPPVSDGKPHANKSIRHLTINTGHCCDSPRSGVQDHVIDYLRPIVRNGFGNIPECELSVKITKAEGGAMFTIDRAGMPLVTCGLALSAEASPAVWNGLTVAVECQCDLWRRLGTPEILANISKKGPPASPWLAVLLWPLCVLAPDTALLLGDMERCIAWTIIDEYEKQK